MSTTKIEIPGEDAWVLARLGQMLAKRLVYGLDESSTRQGLLRLLFGVQRLPILIPDLCISLGANRVYVEINGSLFGLVSFTGDGHTEFRLQYFSGSGHCLSWNEFLAGDAKRDAIDAYLQQLECALADGERLLIEDHSVGRYVDEPPLEDFMEYAASHDQS